MPTDDRLPWGLILALGAAALVRPLLSIAGVYDLLGPMGRPGGPLLVTAVVSAGWIALAVARRVRRPVATLALAGVAYAVFAVLLNLALQPILDSAEPIPPAGIVAMLVTNGVQGAVLGLVALAVASARRAPR